MDEQLERCGIILKYKNMAEMESQSTWVDKKIKIGWFSFSCCEDNTIVMTEVMSDLNAGLGFLNSHGNVKKGKLASIGFCWGGARSFFGSEGLFLLRATGSGPILLSSYGAIHQVQMTGAAPYLCDTGHVVAFTQNLEFDVRKVGGWKSTLLSGEGLVCEFRGSGTLYLQTRSTQAFLSWLIPRIPTGTGGGGAGRGGGILGNILRGN